MSGNGYKKRLTGRRILLGVTGSIAAYKACEVIRRLQRQGAEIRVIMTKASAHFVAPLTFETLTGHEVVTSMFPDHTVEKTRHVHLAEWAECMLICPATANIIGKIASGIADDFLSTEVLAARCPVVIAPAMDYQMVQNPVYLDNCRRLSGFGMHMIETEEGPLASGATGPGRLASYDRIMDSVYKALLGSKSLSGVKVLVTAGPTREFLDPVRYLSNPSTGTMGYALAEAAALRGGDVTLITGPSQCRPFHSVNVVRIISASEMADAVKKAWKTADILIMAAAVADFAPVRIHSQKIKKTGPSDVTLKPTEDILQAIPHRNKSIIAGFALETENDVLNAVKKLKSKRLDLICLNNPTHKGAGFGTETNQITLIGKNEKAEKLPLMPKWKAANVILDFLEKIIEERTGRGKS